MIGCVPSFGFGLQHPLAKAFIAFEMLPSLNLHPSQAARLLPSERARSQGASLKHWHRHWSAALRKTGGLDPVTALDDPALPLAMLPAEGFHRLRVALGVVLEGTRLRHCIAREALAEVQAQLGKEALDFARHQALAFEVAPMVDATAPRQALGDSVLALGAGVLVRVFAEATPPVGLRGRLRLPTDAEDASQALLLDPGGARQLSRSLLSILDPQWLSWFPAIR